MIYISKFLWESGDLSFLLGRKSPKTQNQGAQLIGVAVIDESDLVFAPIEESAPEDSGSTAGIAQQGKQEICPDCGGLGCIRPFDETSMPDFCYRCGGTGKLPAGCP